MTGACAAAPLPLRAGGERAFVIAVLALLGLRLLLVVLLWAVGGEPLQPDSPLYLQLAAALADKGWFSVDTQVYVPEVFRTPGYPAYLAAFLVQGVPGTFWPLLGQELLYLATVAAFFVGTRSMLDGGLARAVVI